jgi:hypothetical protein
MDFDNMPDLLWERGHPLAALGVTALGCGDPQAAEVVVRCCARSPSAQVIGSRAVTANDGAPRGLCPAKPVPKPHISVAIGSGIRSCTTGSRWQRDRELRIGECSYSCESGVHAHGFMANRVVRLTARKHAVKTNTIPTHRGPFTARSATNLIAPQRYDAPELLS